MKDVAATGGVACLGLVLITILAAGVWAGITYLITWLAVYAATGFNHPIPFWPTFCIVALVQFFLGIIGRKMS